ncbi:GNAT family N-acetyltransferase [Aureimonas populi]|uniref:GNAT family N-acetyltransferase n=1 Tax=Aureimonas populi TaxID=1701758 RepID=A0ABW5CPT3_9HYPH|nr:GNAT family protein [Aureimonas populi]
MRLLDWLTGAPLPVLRGNGLVLRLPRGSDYRQWSALRYESRDFLTPWEPAWSEDELSAKSYRLRLMRYRQDARERTGYGFFIFDESGRTLYGGLTLGLVRRGVAQTATLGYWMGERYAGQGHMGRAIDLVCTFAFEVERLHRLEAACLPSNQRSNALLMKSGFRREGLLRKYLMIAGTWEDHHLYALLAEEWSSSPARSGADSRMPAPAVMS